MKILINVSHPGHVHLFKYFIDEIKGKGHEVHILSRNREITNVLLSKYGFKYTKINKSSSKIYKKVLNLLLINKQIYNRVNSIKPDVIIGVADIYGSHVGRLLDIPSVVFDDTEDSSMEILLFKYTANLIFTPSCYRFNINQKHLRYDGYHELAYLHPDRFSPDSSVIEELGLTPKDRFSVVRFSSWDAFHDIGQGGFSSLDQKILLVKLLENHGKVFITSETSLPKFLENRKLKISPDKIHSLLYYANLYVGEGHTMATEASLLGTPSFIISSRIGTNPGNYEDLKKFGLIETFDNPVSAMPKIRILLENSDSKQEWREKSQMLIRTKIDVTKFMVDMIDNLEELLGKKVGN